LRTCRLLGRRQVPIGGPAADKVLDPGPSVKVGHIGPRGQSAARRPIRSCRLSAGR
jgi:hypothetical protein